ncbi:2-keto-4-pentenoate hydratase [Domibacillus epiphyticus]|uniref:2-keto-4-pentenoate hydratase n=1 Tax=Domibacillus epiphyticus TaxID=1714355 RepID=A0A1V2ABR1_9BACI|nr:2-keto-4-pentenoate hydratase [Domibacillus epiphyticus]OMP68433.1 2-keto-4-pentenoate hydratase [Domibacillus epiphyticus]
MNLLQTVSFSDRLAVAEENANAVKPLTERHPDISVREAYMIQLKTIERKVEAGASIVGKKIGLTSLAMQKLLGVDQPDYGHLLNRMEVEDGGKVSLGRLIQPKVEAEIAFKLNQDLVGPRVTSTEVLLATEYIQPALEIVDSRIEDWQIKLQDTIADNASSGMYVLGGQPVSVDKVDLSHLGMAFYKNNKLVNTGVGAAALGGPANAIAWLANKLFEFGIYLEAGEIILSGALSAAVQAEAGDVFTARMAHIGEVSVTFTD